MTATNASTTKKYCANSGKWCEFANLQGVCTLTACCKRVSTTKETTATTKTISLDAFPKAVIQRAVEVSDESIEKIADAVVRKLADHKTEQTERSSE